MQFGKTVGLFALCLSVPMGPVRGNEPMTREFQPDPKSVQRYGPAYRYPQAGWIVLHIEGEPYERGYQHGRLLAPEIAAFVKNSASTISPSAPAEGWKTARTLINALFLRRYEKEYLEEMKGIADGASAAGARYQGRPVDLVDIVGLNVWPEIETLDSALEATPTGLEGTRFKNTQARAMPAPKEMHCSAFAATGPATADGKVVFGHITMFGLYQSYFYNVWLDVKPSRGNRVIIQGYPGAIQSGMDYYLNDKGLLITETTIAQTRFDITGLSVASRIRKALQYADNIDQAVEILKAGNNGLYTNEWLLADTKTNEIAMFELGTHKSRLFRSSKGEWPGGTAGFYWGCNNTKDLEVRLETIPGVNGRPANMIFCPSDRDTVWLRLYEKYKGKIDVNFAREAFTTPPLAAYHSLDAKFTTTDLTKDLKSWALFGPPLGRTWEPTLEERRRHPDIQPLVSNPWTLLHVQAPAADSGKDLIADLAKPSGSTLKTSVKDVADDAPLSRPAWHGTILPKSDGDIWLATAFADYERFVARENAFRERDGALTEGARNRLSVDLYARRSRYLASSRALSDVPLTEAHGALGQSDWYEIAANKGFLLLHELRSLLGDTTFQEMMDKFGTEHAGHEVATAEFQAHAERAAGKPLNSFFSYWLHGQGLPRLGVGKATVTSTGKGYKVDTAITRDGNAPLARIQVDVVTSKGRESKTLLLDSPTTPFTFETNEKPLRLIVDPYNLAAKANGGVYATESFHRELDKTLIVYGTADEVASNREAALGLQRAIIRAHSNFTVPIKADREVAREELKTHHLLLIGLPSSNSLVKEIRSLLPIEFGERSFKVGEENYAHSGSSVMVAAENPLDGRYSVVVIAGLSPEATCQTAPAMLEADMAQVVITPNKARARGAVVTPKELTRDLTEAVKLAGSGSSMASRAQ
jgi:hypothetical protein